MKRKQITFILAIIVLVAIFGWQWKQQQETTDLVTQEDAQLEETLEIFLTNQITLWQEAIAAHESLGEDPPLDLYLLVALNAKHLGDYALAREMYERYFTYHKTNYSTYDNYGRLLRKMGDLSGAEQAFETAIALNPNVEAYYHDLARVLQEQGRDEELEDLYQKAIDQIGQTRALLVALAGWYEAFGDCEQALDHYGVAKQLAENEGVAAAIGEEIDRLKATCQ